MAITQAQLQELQEIHKCNFLLLVQANNLILGAMDIVRSGGMNKEQGDSLGTYIKFIEKQVSDWRNSQKYYESSGAVPAFDGKFFSYSGQKDLTDKANALLKIVKCGLAGATEDLRREFEKYNFTPSILDWLLVPWKAAIFDQVETVRRIQLARVRLNEMIQKTQASCAAMGLSEGKCQALINKNLEKVVKDLTADEGGGIMNLVKLAIGAMIGITVLQTLQKSK